MESYKENHIEKDVEHLNLPEDTLVFIEESQQFGFFERPSKTGFSKIKNIGVVKNTEIRKPTDEEMWFYADEHNIDESSAEYKDLLSSVKLWDRKNENSPETREINEKIDEYNELKGAVAFAESREDLPDTQKEYLEQDKEKLIKLSEEITRLKKEADKSIDKESLYNKIPL
jgi:hypothetical protein